MNVCCFVKFQTVAQKYEYNYLLQHLKFKSDRISRKEGYVRLNLDCEFGQHFTCLSLRKYLDMCL